MLLIDDQLVNLKDMDQVRVFGLDGRTVPIECLLSCNERRQLDDMAFLGPESTSTKGLRLNTTHVSLEPAQFSSEDAAGLVNGRVVCPVGNTRRAVMNLLGPYIPQELEFCWELSVIRHVGTHKAGCIVHTVPMGCGIGPDMHMRRDSHNLRVAFTTALMAAVEINCRAFILSDYLTTGLFMITNVGIEQCVYTLGSESPIPEFMAGITGPEISPARRASVYYSMLRNLPLQLGSIKDQKVGCGQLVDFTNQVVEPLQRGYESWAQVYKLRGNQVIKVYDPQFYSIEQLRTVSNLEIYHNEVSAYHQLEPLQGTVVPKLVAFGNARLANIHGPFIIIEFAENHNKHCNFEVAANALGKIHALGYCHNDLLLRNIRFNRGHAMFIDFGFASRTPSGEYDPREHKREYHSLQQSFLCMNQQATYIL